MRENTDQKNSKYEHFSLNANYEEIKLSSSSVICNTIYDNGSYLMFFGKLKLQSFNMSGE